MRSYFRLLLATFSVVSSLAAIALPATAQVTRTADGHVTVQSGVYRFQTGELGNDSNIPLPTVVPERVSERVALPFDPTQLAPNTVNVSIDTAEVQRQVREQTGFSVGDVSATVTGKIDKIEGSHQFAEGVQVTDAQGDSQTAFVRGAAVTIGPDDQSLPETAQVTVGLRNDEVAQVRVLNIRNNGATPTESGVYFDAQGNLITEDLPNGGLSGFGSEFNQGNEPDFDDGNNLGILGGTITADVSRSTSEVVTDTIKDEWEPTSNTASDLLGFVDSEGNGTATSRFTAESDGNIRYSYQAAPIGSINRPLLLNVGAQVNPFADSNTQSFGVNFGARQFLTPTHRTVSGTEASNLVRLLPTSSITGNGSAAYNNIGGTIIQYADGSSDFVVQWIETDSEVERSDLSFDFNKAEVVGFLSAIAPEQPGTDQLRLDEFLSLSGDGDRYYLPNGVGLIAEDLQPENFRTFSEPEHLLVEDTLPSGNANVPEFNGRRIPGTVDFDDAIVSLSTQEVDDLIVENTVPNRFGLYLGANVGIGMGDRTSTETTTTTTTTTEGVGLFDVSDRGVLAVRSLDVSDSTAIDVSTSESSSLEFAPVSAEAVLGAVLTYAGTPWTENASTIRGELYGGTDSGLRAEVRQAVGGGVAGLVKADYRFGGETSVVAGVSVGF